MKLTVVVQHVAQRGRPVSESWPVFVQSTARANCFECEVDVKLEPKVDDGV